MVPAGDGSQPVPGLQLGGGLCEVAGREEDVVDLQQPSVLGLWGEARTPARRRNTARCGHRVACGSSFVGEGATRGARHVL